ncbi:MAG: SIS domain-containing protein [Phycisphaerae bacterium]|nr:SIS domain-containing protein [Phycisphaerae bacterium]MBT5656445.1 SIS domain-containing protein [Phycisphaerae bacterium]
MLANRLKGSLEAITSLTGQIDTITAMAETLVECLSRNGTIWTAGNGGSAAQALHFSEELVGRYRNNRRALGSAMLSGDPTLLSCTANDYGFDQVFVRPLEALASADDAVLVLSTSGNSTNIVLALQAAKERGCATVGLFGGDGGACKPLCDHAIVVDATDSAFIQDAHQVAIHLLCEAIEQWAMATEPEEATS